MKSVQFAALLTKYSVNPFLMTSKTNFKNTESEIMIDLVDLYNKNADEPDFDCEFLHNIVQD